MGEVINLNHARKAKRRGDDQARATANRAAFGRTKAEKAAAAAAADAERRERLLDGTKRED